MRFFKFFGKGVALVLIGLLIAIGLAPSASAGSKTWTKFCNASGSYADMYVKSPSGSVSTVPDGVCKNVYGSGPNGDQYQIQIGWSSNYHRVSYNGQAYSSCRANPSGFFTPANYSEVKIKNFRYGGCHN